MTFPLQVRRMTFSAPRRHWVQGPGGWSSEPWAGAAIIVAVNVGMWFTGAEDFRSSANRLHAMRLSRVRS